VQIRGKAKGEILVQLEEEGRVITKTLISIDTKEWVYFEENIDVDIDVHPIFFGFEGESSLDFLSRFLKVLI